MGDTFVRQLTKNEMYRFKKEKQKCEFCGERITATPIAIKSKWGRCVDYSFFHISCFLQSGLYSNSRIVNAWGLENLVERRYYDEESETQKQ